MSSAPSASITGQGKKILPAEEAFTAAVVSRTPSKVTIQVIAAPGTYLYRDKFALKTQSGGKIGLTLPKGQTIEDAFFGKSEILRGEVVLTNTKKSKFTGDLSLELQGCADAGICYPPMRLMLSSSIASHTTVNTAPAVAALENKLKQHQGRLVMLDFYADWCLPCKQMEKTTFVDPRVQQALKDIAIVKIDLTKNKADEKAILSHYQVPAPPAFVFLDKTGKEIAAAKWVGYASAEDLLAQIALAKKS